MALEKVLVVNPPKKGRKKASSRRKRNGGSRVATKRKSNPAGKHRVKGYTRRDGTRVKAHYAKNPKRRRRRNKSRRRRKSNARTRRTRRRGVYRNPRPRTRTRTVTKYRYRKSNPKVVYRYRKRRNPRRRRRSRRRNPSTASAAPFRGAFNMQKIRQMWQNIGGWQAMAGGAAGAYLATTGPAWLSQRLGWDFVTGYRDPLWSSVISLGGGIVAGKIFDPKVGYAFAIAGMAMAAMKVLRVLAQQGVAIPGFSRGFGRAPGIGAGNVLGLAASGFGQEFPVATGPSNYGPFYKVGEITTHV